MPKIQRKPLVIVAFIGLVSLSASAQKIIATLPMERSPRGTVVNKITNKVYVVNQCGTDPDCQSNGTVTVIDGATLSTATVAVGISPSGINNPIAVNQATNKVYVANACGNVPLCRSNGTVTVIDGATLATTTVSVGFNPQSVAVNEQTNKIYVVNACGNDGSCRSNGTVTVIDGATLATMTVDIQFSAYWTYSSVGVNPQTNKIYVTNPCGTDPNCNSNGSVTVIDGATLSTTTVEAQRTPEQLAINTVTNKIFIANGSMSVTVLDGNTLSTATVPIGFPINGIAVNQVTNKAYVVGNGMTVIDGQTLGTQSIQFGVEPYVVVVNSVTNKIYVTDDYWHYVSAIDGSDLSYMNVDVQGGPLGAAVNEVTNRIYVANSCVDQGYGCGLGATGSVSVMDGTPPTALQFVPLTQPCRAVDTRPEKGGGGPIQGGTHQDFPISGAPNCGIPASAAAYSLNVTVVPQGYLSYLTVWPTGQPQPSVSTLNSLDGRIKANAAIVPAGASGDVSVYATDTTNVILDIDGYFAPVSGSTLAFYPLPPCRIADTRKDTFPPGLGSPYLTGRQERPFPILNATACNI
ncbi:MAG TPA: YncE family protein, partial [Candidatus Limnocylindrales bacterium]|nr:YncE family protein [Candidatus Limnocylindrales bacterium]